MFKKKLLPLFLLFLTLAPIVSASDYRDKGLYGKLSYLYNEEESLNSGSSYSTQQSNKLFTVGYLGNIYSPKLIDYSIEGTIRYDESETKFAASDSSTIKTDSQDYILNMNFIKDSRFPFSVSLSEQNSIVLDSKIKTEQKSIKGNMNFEPINFNYGASKSNSVSENNSSSGVNEYDNYNAGISYHKNSHTFNANYMHTEQTYNQKYESYGLTTYRDDLLVNDLLNVNYSWIISKELEFSSSGSHDIDKESSSKSTNADFSLQWRPDEKYSGSLSANGSRYEYQNGVGGTEETLDIFGINQNFTYMVTDSFILSEYANMTNFSSPVSEGSSSSVNLNANHNYNRNIFSDSILNVSTNAAINQMQSKTETILDSNISANTSSNRKLGTYSFNTGASIAKPLQSISSSLNLNASYYYMQTTDNTESQIYSAGSSLSSAFSAFRNNLSATVTKQDSGKSSTVGTYVRDTVDTSVSLGIRGNMNLNAGVSHSNTKSDNMSVESISFNTGTSLNYRFFTKLMFSMGANASQDIVADYLAYSGSSSLSYSAGKTSLSINYVYNKTEYERVVYSATPTTAGSTLYEAERTSLRAKIERRF